MPTQLQMTRTLLKPLQENLRAASATIVGVLSPVPERQRIFDAVIANLKQHYFDPAVAQQMAEALVAHVRRGDDAAATDQAFAALLTTQLRDVSHDPHLEAIYS